jgi:hypothetical protein
MSDHPDIFEGLDNPGDVELIVIPVMRRSFVAFRMIPPHCNDPSWPFTVFYDDVFDKIHVCSEITGDGIQTFKVAISEGISTVEDQGHYYVEVNWLRQHCKDYRERKGEECQPWLDQCLKCCDLFEGAIRKHMARSSN